MHVLDNIRRWVGALAELGISIIALGVVLQVLFGDETGAASFLSVDVLGSVVGFVSALGSEGLVGLIALGILWWAYNKRSA
ncbi:MAG: hypothetical protein HOD33_04205 [Acidiferrobacteraceae bacterium]|nr:hypothetical protein [Acidiferrobacteraceae bacterium]MBT4394360.1 hypothetical protein [Acidiferrobacteraceae bacterium]